MTDNQEKKLSQQQIQQRDFINNRLEKAAGKKISDIFRDDLPGKKAFYYRHVVNMPLKQSFISFILSQFGIDLNFMNDYWETEKHRANKENDQEKEILRIENESLKREIALLKELIEVYKNAKK